MKKYLKLLLIMAGIVVIITAVFIIDKVSQHIPNNPPGTIGNTAGNLFNNGLFCEDTQGNVFFANSYDEDTMYKMSADEENIEKIFHSSVSHINAGDRHLYFYVKNSSSSSGLGFVRRLVGLYRCTKEGRNTTTLCRDPASALLLMNDSIFLQHYDTDTNTTLWKLSTDGEVSEQISREPINPCSGSNGYIYYTNTSDTRFLYRMNTTTNRSEIVVKYDMWNPICRDGYIYFMDMHNDYRVCRYDCSDETVLVLTNERVDTFNLSNAYLYYQTNSTETPALKRISMTDLTEETVIEGVFKNINVTSRYVYFQDFMDTGFTYHTPADGAIAVSEFTKASTAADLNRD